ncbi:MAG: peptidylprolyl isomerase, partial [Nitrosopumilus sp.]
MKKILLTLIFSLIIITSTTYAFAQNYQVPVVVLETTQGEIIIELFKLDAPNHSENFLLLSKMGYYDGVLFHRIIPGFMIQSGDPNSIDGDPNTWGTGGPDSFVSEEFNSIKHNR